eukprot:GILJ01006448.1.p1 GENE.GILJ01006448.1~~GILJ01006448.1.p1  ORF type:complete len:779 (-),score=109.83 GILJ01006448.1:310-2592(-)
MAAVSNPSRAVDTSSTNSNDASSKLVNVDYFLVVDFEATCDDSPEQASQEIIEFPWVLIDSQTGSEISYSQRYCKPQKAPITSFCTEFTGIIPTMVEDAGSLREALDELDTFIQNEMYKQGKTFCILTHGNWDLEYCLRLEARDKQLTLPPYWSRYFDLRIEFLKWCEYVKSSTISTSLKSMAHLLQVPLEGRLHCGLDDCRTIVSITKALLQHKDAIPSLFSECVDFAAEREVFERNEERVLSARGIPYSCSEQDIQQYFAKQFKIESVHLCLMDDGRSAGNAYVLFHAHADASAALDNRWMMGSRSIHVRPSALHEYNIERIRPTRRAIELAEYATRKGTVVKLKSLPWKFSVTQIAGCLSNYDISSPVSVAIIRDELNRPSGSAVVQYATHEDAMKVLDLNRKLIIEGRSISTLPSDEDELLRALAQTVTTKVNHPHHHHSQQHHSSSSSSSASASASASTLKVSTPRGNTPSSSRRTLATADLSKIHISRQRSLSISVRGRGTTGDIDGENTAEDETSMSTAGASGQTDVKDVGGAGQTEKEYTKTDKHITKQQQDEAHISIFMVCVISIGLTFVQETVRDWAAIYLEARAGADDAVAGYITLAFPVMGGFSALLCSQFMKTQRQRTLVLLVAAVLCTASMVGLYLLERFYYDTTVPLVIVGLLVSLVGLAVQGPLALVTALAVVEHGEETAGRLAGMLDGMMYIGGIVEGIAVGVLISKAGWSSVYLMAACVGLATCFAVFRVMEKTFRRGVPSL